MTAARAAARRVPIPPMISLAAFDVDLAAVAGELVEVLEKLRRLLERD